MRKGTLARLEIYQGIALFAAMLVLAGYGLVSALADRLDPKVRDCVARSQQEVVRVPLVVRLGRELVARHALQARDAVLPG